SSNTFGKWFSIELTAENKTQLYVPVGFAHGFATLSGTAEVQYKQTEFYQPAAEGGIAWNDPDIAIQWPFRDPILSKRDQNQMSLNQYLKNPAFKYALIALSPFHASTGLISGIKRPRDYLRRVSLKKCCGPGSCARSRGIWSSQVERQQVATG